MFGCVIACLLVRLSDCLFVCRIVSLLVFVYLPGLMFVCLRLFIRLFECFCIGGVFVWMSIRMLVR